MSYDVIISAKIPAEINDIIEHLAKQEFTSKSAIVRKFLIRGLEAEGFYDPLRKEKDLFKK